MCALDYDVGGGSPSSSEGPGAGSWPWELELKGQGGALLPSCGLWPGQPGIEEKTAPADVLRLMRE